MVIFSSAKKIVAVVATFLSAVTLHVNAETISYPNLENAADQYAAGILKLALSKHGTTANLIEQNQLRSNNGELFALANGDVSVVWQETDKQLESEYQAIEVPIFKGLFGYKTLLVRDQDKFSFSSISKVSDLAKLSLGMPRDRQDVEILKANNIEVITSNKQTNLLYMLEGGRFDALPYSVFEAAMYDSTEAKSLNLTTDEHVLLSYANPVYFFVNKDNVQLANQIRAGLAMAIEDGSFERYFASNTLIQSTLNRLALNDRKVIEIDNPNLPSSAPLANAELWFDVSDSSMMTASYP